MRQLLDTDPGTGSVIRASSGSASGGALDDLVDVLGKHADMEAAAGRKPTGFALRVAIANVWEKDLDSPESAAEALEKVLEVAPHNVAALLSLARLHERNERWDDAGGALERGREGHEPAEIAEIHFRNATILRSKEAEPAEIEAALLRAIDADAGHRPTLEALEKIAREAKDEERLANILDLELRSAADDGERRRLLREIAGLYGGPLAQPSAALPYLERLVALDPTEITGREQLAEALIAAGRTDQATRIIGELVAGRPRRGAGRRRRAGRRGSARSPRCAATPEGAAASFDAAYKLDPSHPATIAALGRLAYRRSDFEAAGKFYRSLLLQNFDDATAGVSKSEVYLMLGRMHVLANESQGAQHVRARAGDRSEERRPEGSVGRSRLGGRCRKATVSEANHGRRRAAGGGLGGRCRKATVSEANHGRRRAARRQPEARRLLRAAPLGPLGGAGQHRIAGGGDRAQGRAPRAGIAQRPERVDGRGAERMPRVARQRHRRLDRVGAAEPGQGPQHRHGHPFQRQVGLRLDDHVVERRRQLGAAPVSPASPMSPAASARNEALSSRRLTVRSRMVRARGILAARQGDERRPTDLVDVALSRANHEIAATRHAQPAERLQLGAPDEWPGLLLGAADERAAGAGVALLPQPHAAVSRTRGS